ncbi:dihydrolipoyl dehydrogenase [Clostridia bacterium]|nr:dihydrolipoyl dehydrogenase [Clostridia bacterium]
MYNLCVVGGGPGGYVAAIRAAQLGAKVVLIEKEWLGGTCLNVGCIPTKALVASTSVLSDIKNAASFGIEVEGVGFDFKKMMERKDKIVSQLVGGVGFLMKKNNVDVIDGTAKLIGKNAVEVTTPDGTQTVEAENIILATGSEAALIKALSYDGKNVITSKEALSLTEVPKSMLVIGGGVIGCEFAMIYAELGVKVTIVEALDRILPMVDPEISKRMTTMLKKKRIKISTGKLITGVEVADGSIKATLESGKEVEAEKALISIGRTFNSKGLGLEETGVEIGQRGEIVVDEYLKTNVENIYAIGDVTNKIQLAHVASAQGIVCVENMFKDGPAIAMKYDVVPSCIFTSPEIATVGISEAEAEEKGIEIAIGKFDFKASGKALCIGHNDGFVKIIADKATDKILGVHIMGPHATDLIAEGVLAVEKGITVEELTKTIHAHPTLSESVMEAAEAVHGMSIHS